MSKHTRVLAVVRSVAVACVAMAGLLAHSGTIRADQETAGQDPVSQDQADPGEEIFRIYCAPCHTIGGGIRVGPDLQGLSDRRSEEWILNFVQHSQQMVEAGDPDAVAVFEEFKIIMPDQPLPEHEILAAIEFIATAGAAGGAFKGTEEVEEEATEEQIRLGQDLFQGKARLANSGPTCNACHEVRNDAVIGGGLLAPDLTTVISRLSSRGVRAILAQPPFPVMRQAYVDRALTDEEVTALVGFLEQADADQALYQPREYGIKLFSAGIAGTALLLFIYTLIWRRRLRGSVNQAIFDRQIRST